jgi:hypothetical protein
MAILVKKAMKSIYFKRILMVLGLMFVALILVWSRAFIGSIQAYHKGETYLEGKQYVRAVTFFDRSIHWYTPFNPFIEKSAERLWEIGEQAEKEGDIQLALIAYRTIRSGFYGASHFVIPGKIWIEKCDRKINALKGKKEREISEDSGSLKEALIQEQRNTAPAVLWTIVLEIGFLGWIGSVIGFIMFRLRHKKEDEYRSSSGFLWLIPTVCFFGLWIIGMMKA